METILKSTHNATLRTIQDDFYVDNGYNNYMKEFLESFGLLFGFLIVVLLCFFCDAMNGEYRDIFGNFKHRPYDPQYDHDLPDDAQILRRQHCYVCGHVHQLTNVGPCKNGWERPLYYGLPKKSTGASSDQQLSSRRDQSDMV